MRKESLKNKFGEVVRKKRTEKGVSQEHLAELAHLHRTYISLLERGQRNPSLDVIAALARALDTTMAELLADLE